MAPAGQVSTDTGEGAHSEASASTDAARGGGGAYFLPKSGELSEAERGRFKAIGKAIVKCFYEGKRVGSR
jgi:hypothetical protein